MFNVREFGAAGDGRTLDTPALQAALEACRARGGGTVTVPAGRYLTGALVLHSHLTLHLEAGAILLGSEDPAHYPVIRSRWEGREQDTHAPLIGGRGLAHIALTGRGVIDGQGAAWWQRHRDGTLPYPRPRLISFSDCEHVVIEGITATNSPSWTIHPVRCANVTIHSVTVLNPPDAPNTDGINPDSCRYVRISDCHVDVGDDCVALKAGIETEAPERQAPCEHIAITNCTLARGHGGVVIGSEMSGGVRHVVVSNCVFTGTDRGLRLKSRRGRGGVVEDVRLSNVVMTEVLCPLSLNLYYHIGARGDRYVSDRGPQPVGAGTPHFRRLHLSHLTARGVRVAAAFVAGLPEAPIEDLSLEDVSIELAPEAEPGFPDMADGLAPMQRAGLMAAHVRGLRLRDVRVTGQLGPVLRLTDCAAVDLSGATPPAEAAGAQAMLPPDRYFDPDPRQKALAQDLYERVKDLPLICPHGHVDPRLLADPDYAFGTPVELLLIPDHYIFRMLYSQGISLERLGIPRRDGGPVETDHRRIWQTFADHYYLFRGTPTGAWLAHELHSLFGLEEPLNAANAQQQYDQIAAHLAAPAFRPRALFERFNIEVLCTTDAAADPLDHHQALRTSGWGGRVIPCFRPDAVVNLDTPGWGEHLARLEQAVGREIGSYRAFIAALEDRRAFFKSLGAVATDHAALTAETAPLSEAEAEAIFQRALRGAASTADAARFTAHMLGEMARMSLEDGLVMQLHAHALRNHNEALYAAFGADKGADIPIHGEFTRALRPLLNRYGNDPRLRLILFTLDETTYARELAPLAGHYPAVLLGPPWWFHDSLNGLARYFDQVMETAGLYNTAGFNDDTRAFCSIPARHDLWRRASANWCAGLVVRGRVGLADAEAMVADMAYGLAKRAYKLDDGRPATARQVNGGSKH